MPINLDDMKKRTKGSVAADLIADNKIKTAHKKLSKDDKNSVANLIGREKTFEKNFKRQTYYIHKDLIEKIDKLAQYRKLNGEKGVKTKVINEIIEQYFYTNK